MTILITTKNRLSNAYKEITMDTHIEMSNDDIDNLHVLFSKHHPNDFVNFIWKRDGADSNSFIFGQPYIEKQHDFR